MKTAFVSLRLDPELKAKLQSAAEKDRRSLNSMIEIILLKYIEDKDHEKDD